MFVYLALPLKSVRKDWNLVDFIILERKKSPDQAVDFLFSPAEWGGGGGGIHTYIQISNACYS